MPGKFELIAGEIVFKMGQGREHIATVILIMKALIRVFGIDYLQCQAEIGIGDRDEYNDPEPDVSVLIHPTASYRDREPNPQNDILLVVVAAVTSLKGDLTTKANIYSRWGIPEYWVVAVGRRQLIVHRGPSPTGYTSVTVYDADASVAALANENVLVSVAELLG